MINLSPNCETSLGFDGVSSPNSYLLVCLNFKLEFVLHSIKLKKSSHNYGTNQIKYKLGLKTTQFIIVFG